jgi:aryl-alcohol dehydrogenase-like predicted oxidoreductase
MLRYAHPPDTIRIGDHEVRRLGYGAMRLPGQGVWGEPPDVATAHAVLRRAVELGVNLIDTAWYYGPDVANRLIVEALHPYPRDLVIATKLGARRLPDKSWIPALAPDELRMGLETDLRSLRLDQLPIVHLRWVEHSPVPFLEALDAMIDFQRQGKVRHLAVSNVTPAQLEQALARTVIVAVQNAFGLRASSGPVPVAADPEGVLAICERRGIAFLPFFPLAMGTITTTAGSIATIAKRLGCTPAQLAIAWLLARSPVMVPIPGTGNVSHLEENVGAVHVQLDTQALTELAT